MAKVEKPLHSLGAHGSLSNSLTYRKRGRQTIAEKIPSHPDAQTFLQIRQRWRFWEAIQEWHSLTSAEQEAYRIAGGKIGLTVYQYYLRYYFKNSMGPVLWLPLDYHRGTRAYDYAPSLNHLTIFGPSWTSGKIRSALQGDGIDDYANAPHHTSLDLTTELTLLCWINPQALAGWYIIANKGNAVVDRYGFWVNVGGSWVFYSADLTPNTVVGAAPPLNTWTHIGVTFHAGDANLALYSNGSNISNTPVTGVIATDGFHFSLFGESTIPLLYPFPGILDDIRLYARRLSPARMLHIATEELRPPPSYLPR